MRNNPTIYVERGRLLDGEYATRHDSGPDGAYVANSPFSDGILRMIVSSSADVESEGWEHVSVSLFNRVPLWEEMQWVKEQFWRDDETVFQLHPAKKEYVNCHPFCLHLWRHVSFSVPVPPKWMV